MAESNAYFIAVGIDFGTTHSGVAWTWSGQPKEVNLISKWDSNTTRSGEQVKVPTEISYDAKGDISWGLCSGAEPLKWFKLLLAEGCLQETIASCDVLERTRSMLGGRQVLDVVADYLKFLWNYAVANMEKRLSKEAVAIMRFRIVITLPAVWDDQAQNLMRKAAKNAGLLKHRSIGETTLNFVTEPEAAALATLRDFDGRPDVKAGDVFVVCDAGGGTVDLISYEVVQTKPLRIKECVEGSGGLCGGVYLDLQFLAYMRALMGQKDFEALGDAKRKELLDTNWETGIKRNFDGSGNGWTVTIPSIGYALLNDKTRGIEHGRTTIKGGHVKQMFEPICSKVTTLVRKQVAAVQEKMGKSPKAILLVGGFGSNDYLYKTLQKYFPRISVQQPARAWSAVSLGALESCISSRALLVSRVSRVNYGVKFDTLYEDGVHDPRDKSYDRTKGQYYARDQIRWYLKKGEPVSNESPVRNEWVRHFRELSEYQKGLHLNLWKSNVINAPTRTTNDVKKFCTIRCSLTENFDRLEKFDNGKGVITRKLRFELVMLVDGTSLDFVVYLNGTPQARERVEVEYQ